MVGATCNTVEWSAETLKDGLACLLLTTTLTPKKKSLSFKWKLFREVLMLCVYIYITHYVVLYVMFALTGISLSPTEKKKEKSEYA